MEQRRYYRDHPRAKSSSTSLRDLGGKSDEEPAPSHKTLYSRVLIHPRRDFIPVGRADRAPKADLRGILRRPVMGDASFAS